MTDTPLLRRLLWSGTAVCLVAAVLAAAVIGAGDDDGADSNLTSTGDTTTTAHAGNGGDAGGGGGGDAQATATTSAGAAAGGGATATTARAGTPSQSQSQSPTTTAASGGGGTAAKSGFKDLGPVDNAGAVSIPAQGLYQYTYKAGEESGEASTKVEHKGAAPGGGQSLVVSVAGQGFDSVNDITWGPNEVRTLKSTFAFGTQKAECDWNPDYLEMQLALAKGSTWQADSSCMISGVAPQPVPVTRRSTVKVTDARKVQVAGTEVMVWVMEAVDHTEAAGTVSDRTYTDWFSPKHGLTVRQSGKVKATGARGGGREESYELEIKSLQPG